MAQQPGLINSETRKRENTSTWFEGRNAKIFQFTDHK